MARVNATGRSLKFKTPFAVRTRKQYTQMANDKTSRSSLLCSSLLEKAQLDDAEGVSITSITRSSLTKSTILKLATPSSDTALQVAQRLRDAFPLFAVCSVECFMTGATSTSVHVPSRDEQMELALNHARKLPVAQFLLGIQVCLALCAATSFTIIAYIRFAVL